MSFKELKKGDIFLYSGLIYTKVYDTQALNYNYGFFTFDGNEKIERINKDKNFFVVIKEFWARLKKWIIKN